MRRRWIYSKGQVIEVPQDFVQERLARDAHNIMPDIDPYRSMLDGSEVSSRSKHRAHLKQHGCIEVGNDSSLKAVPKPLTSPPGLKDDLIRAAHEKLR